MDLVVQEYTARKLVNVHTHDKWPESLADLGSAIAADLAGWLRAAA